MKEIENELPEMPETTDMTVKIAITGRVLEILIDSALTPKVKKEIIVAIANYATGADVQFAGVQEMVWEQIKNEMDSVK